MNLRQDIQQIFMSASNPEEASLLTILYLEYYADFSLAGNGWLDNDSLWEELESEENQHKQRQLLDQLQNILTTP